MRETRLQPREKQNIKLYYSFMYSIKWLHQKTGLFLKFVLVVLSNLFPRLDETLSNQNHVLSSHIMFVSNQNQDTVIQWISLFFIFYF